MVRRRYKGEYDEGAFKVLADSVRHMIRELKELEEPFLEYPPSYSSKQSYDFDQADPDDYYDLRCDT